MTSVLSFSPASSHKLFTFHSELWLPHPLTKVFPFFAAAEHLEQLTPPFLNFRILTPRPIVVSRGTRIQYQLKLHGIPIRWESEITGWNPPYFFSDDQLHGLTATGTTEHTFEERDGGTWSATKSNTPSPAAGSSTASSSLPTSAAFRLPYSHPQGTLS